MQAFFKNCLIYWFTQMKLVKQPWRMKEEQPSLQTCYVLVAKRERMAAKVFVSSYAIKCIYVLLGDSGGPLSWNNGQNQEVLIGVVSWGIGCAREGIPGVYAEVSGKMIFYPFVVGIAKHPQNF